MKLATAATPTVHQARTKAGKTGMKEVTSPLTRVRREKRRMDLREKKSVMSDLSQDSVGRYLFLPHISDTIPARKVPTANPEKKIILAMTVRLALWQTSWNSVVTVSIQKEVS